MALQLSLHICQSTNCKELKISETTGSYNASTNPGGWGLPNIPTIAQVTTTGDAVIDITAPDGTLYSFAFSDIGPANFPFPDATGLQEFVLNYSSGIVPKYTNPTNTTGFPDGYYAIKYTVSFQKAPGNPITKVFVNQGILLTCQTRCCIDQLFHLASQSQECVGCNNDLLHKALEAEAYLKSAEYAAGCGKLEMAKQNLAKAKWICNTKNCSNC